MIQAFAYRKPRVAATLPVEFLTDDGVLFGSTRDISEHGLLVAFTEPVLLKTSGRVRFRMGHCLLELRAEVTHADAFTSGLVFGFASEQEQAFLRAVVQALAHAAEHREIAGDGLEGV